VSFDFVHLCVAPRNLQQSVISRKGIFLLLKICIWGDFPLSKGSFFATHILQDYTNPLHPPYKLPNKTVSESFLEFCLFQSGLQIKYRKPFLISAFEKR